MCGRVSHRPRGAGRSNYSNLQRGLVGIVDLMGVAWLASLYMRLLFRLVVRGRKVHADASAVVH